MIIGILRRVIFGASLIIFALQLRNQAYTDSGNEWRSSMMKILKSNGAQISEETMRYFQLYCSYILMIAPLFLCSAFYRSMTGLVLTLLSIPMILSFYNFAFELKLEEAALDVYKSGFWAMLALIGGCVVSV